MFLLPHVRSSPIPTSLSAVSDNDNETMSIPIPMAPKKGKNRVAPKGPLAAWDGEGINRFNFEVFGYYSTIYRQH